MTTQNDLDAFDAQAARYLSALVVLVQHGAEPWHEGDQRFASALDEAVTPDDARHVVRCWYAWRTGSPLPAGAEGTQ